MQTAQPTNNLYAPRHDIYAPHFADAPDAALGARLNYLTTALAEAERRARLFRTPLEEHEMRLMRRPLTTEQAFARFGLLLGTLPPAAIFSHVLIGARHGNGVPILLAFMLPMLAICATLGRFMAKRLGRRFDEAERGSWLKTISVALGYAFIWAAVTGTVGGLPVFIIGGIFGFACALPIALVAFALFVPLQRLLARGGMIDARQLQPLAWGINLVIAALILSPHVIPY
jgi:fatty acid desaturase